MTVNEIKRIKEACELNDLQVPEYVLRAEHELTVKEAVLQDIKQSVINSLCNT